MRKSRYNHLLLDDHMVWLPLLSDYDTKLDIRTPPSRQMAWIEEFQLEDDDWRIEASSEGPHIKFIFRDPGVAMLFKLTFV